MRPKTFGKLGTLRATVGEYLLATDDAPVELVYEDLATELPGFSRLVAGDDSLGVLLEKAQEFLLCWHLLTFEDAAAGLSDPLLYQRQEVFETLDQASGSTTSALLLLLQRFNDFSGLSAACLGDRDQLSVSLF
jgi:hypothetical protein